LIESESQSQHDGQVKLFNLAFAKVLDASVQPELLSQNPEDELVTEGTIFRIEMRICCGEQGR
jgi:hypothetical protein